MNSGAYQLPNPTPPSTTAGGAHFCNGIIRIPRGDMFAMTFAPDIVELTISENAVLELKAALSLNSRCKFFHTVADEAKRLQLSEKTIRTLLKKRGAPHYSIGSDIRIDPAEFDHWLQKNYRIEKSSSTPPS